MSRGYRSEARGAERSDSGRSGFFEKVLGPTSDRRRVEGGRWVGDPVRIHLSELLNTRLGSVPHLEDYGVPDMASYFSDYPASMAELRSVLQELIETYEPRLKRPRVQILETGEGEFRVSFLITGEIEAGDEEGVLVKYRTTIASNGQANLGRAQDDLS